MVTRSTQDTLFDYPTTPAPVARIRAGRRRMLARLEKLARQVDAGRVTGWTRTRRPGADPARQLTFYIGTHRPRWIEGASGPAGRLPDVPWFVSAHTLAQYQRHGHVFPRNRGICAIDSGGFTELRDHGRWRMPPDEYGAMIVRFVMEMGCSPQFVCPQDWMCEPWVIFGGLHDGVRYVGTGNPLGWHLEATVENFCRLAAEFPFIPWMPVLQGWQLRDYERCHELYQAAGIDLAAYPAVGLGSVCRRQATSQIGEIVEHFWRQDLRLHGFGVKRDGLRRYGHMLYGADSMAWSRIARADRDNIRLPGCAHRGTCQNCPRWALVWRELVLQGLRTRQHGGINAPTSVAALLPSP